LESNEICGEVISILGGLPGFLGASYSDTVFSAPVVSISMLVLRDGKKLRVNTDFGDSLTAADFGTGLVDFLAVCEVLLEITS
jgi:hypothetical protein